MGPGAADAHGRDIGRRSGGVGHGRRTGRRSAELHGGQPPRSRVLHAFRTADHAKPLRDADDPAQHRVLLRDAAVQRRRRAGITGENDSRGFTTVFELGTQHRAITWPGASLHPCAATSSRVASGPPATDRRWRSGQEGREHLRQRTSSRRSRASPNRAGRGARSSTTTRSSSISHINTRVIRIEPDGSITAEMLLEEIPVGGRRARGLPGHRSARTPGLHLRVPDLPRRDGGPGRGRLHHAPPRYRRGLPCSSSTYVMQIKAEEEADGTVDIYVTGGPVLTGWVLQARLRDRPCSC